MGDMISRQEATEIVKEEYAEKLVRAYNLMEKYRKTHKYAEGTMKHFEDPSTGVKVPTKIHKSGRYAGEHARETKLYHYRQEGGSLHWELRTGYQNAFWFLKRSSYRSLEDFVADARQKGWVDEGAGKATTTVGEMVEQPVDSDVLKREGELSFTETQRKIIQQAQENPNLTPEALSEKISTSEEYIRSVLKRVNK